MVDRIQLDDDQTDHNSFSDSDEEEFNPVEDSIFDSESDLDEHEDFFHSKFLLFKYLVHLIKFLLNIFNNNQFCTKKYFHVFKLIFKPLKIF